MKNISHALAFKYILLLGFVYYEQDCFSELINPYIPVDGDDDNCYKQTFTQKPLVGEQRKTREDIFKNTDEVGRKWLKGDKITKKDLDCVRKFHACLCEDIKNERARVGGDWVVAGCLTTDFDRYQVRKNLGSDLLMIIINVKNSLGDRLKERHNIEDDKTTEQQTAEYLTKSKPFIQTKRFWERGVIQINFEGNETKEEVMETVFKIINDHFDKKDNSEGCCTC